MTVPDDIEYLRHMLDAIDRIESYVANSSYESFDDDAIRQDAVIRQLEVLGEAAGRVTQGTCNRCESVPWSNITGMRHRLIHGYLEVDLEVVWVTAREAVPGLRTAIDRCIHTLLEAE